jgi:hypothetical protein
VGVVDSVDEDAVTVQYNGRVREYLTKPVEHISVRKGFSGHGIGSVAADRLWKTIREVRKEAS